MAEPMMPSPTTAVVVTVLLSACSCQGRRRAQARRACHRLVEVGQDQGVVGDPAVADDPVGVDDEDRSLRQPPVALPHVVLHPVGRADLAVPVRQQGEVDAQGLREGLLGEGGGDGDAEQVGTQGADLVRLVVPTGTARCPSSRRSRRRRTPAGPVRARGSPPGDTSVPRRCAAAGSRGRRSPTSRARCCWDIGCLTSGDAAAAVG